MRLAVKTMLPSLKPKTMLSYSTVSTLVRFSPKAKSNCHNFNLKFNCPYSSSSSSVQFHSLSSSFSSSSSSSIQFHYPPLDHQWSGLDNWRQGPLNHNRFWGPNGPIQHLNQSGPGPGTDPDTPLISLSSCASLAEMGAVVLSTADPLTKCDLSHFAYAKWRQEFLPVGISQAPPKPSRPLKPQLVSPKEIPPPKTSRLPLNAYMLHNLAHVELNAVDLAWDTVVRFSSYSEILGEGFFADFAHVADDESRHFTWCSQRLAELGFSYGDMPAHNLLWRECEKSSDNITARLAVIPLVQEARGLDAGPRLVKKLIGFGDHRTSNIVAKIADEEVAHVAVGVYWFVSVCQKMGRAPCSTFKEMLEEYNVELKGPFNYSARDKAGIPRQWYDPSSTKNDEENNKLSEVYDRLACIICMEQENSSLGTTPK